MVDDPVNWATRSSGSDRWKPPTRTRRNVMNDTHMAHAMEFPYPQSMPQTATRATKASLPMVLANTNFTPETCKSCHPVQGIDTSRDIWR